jgi:hypothetical protein
MRVDDALTRGGLGGVACAYVDDVLIWSRTMEEHLQHVRAVLTALQAVGFRIHPTKSLYLADHLPSLGHMVTPHGREAEQSQGSRHARAAHTCQRWAAAGRHRSS